MEMTTDLFWAKYHRASQALVEKGLITIDGSGEPNIIWLLAVTSNLATGELKLVEAEDEKAANGAGADSAGGMRSHKRPSI